LFQTTSSVFGIIFPIRFESLYESVCGVIRLIQLLLLNRCCSFESLAGFLARFLHAEGICCLGVELDSTF
jgi:hypothetical protein